VGHAVAQWLRHCATNRKFAGSIPDGVIGTFQWHNPSGRSNGDGVDSASNRNEYQEYSLWVKAAGAEGWQPYHLHVPIVLKSGSLELLEHSGPVKACSGIALHFYLNGMYNMCPKTQLNMCSNDDLPTSLYNRQTEKCASDITTKEYINIYLCFRVRCVSWCYNMEENNNFYWTSIFSYATLIIIQDDLHSPICKIMCVRKENKKCFPEVK
jgi:hypothetical protein